MRFAGCLALASSLCATAVVALSACGDNLLGNTEPLTTSRDLVVVAHQDDDLIFMQPDLMETVSRGEGVTALYITAGNGSGGPDASDPRYAGLLQAYGAMAGDFRWNCGYIHILAHLAQRCRLASANVSLVFLAYPDGGRFGQNASSLLHLWEGTIDSATTVSRYPSTYDRDQLIEAVADVIRMTQPRTVHTLDVAATHGDDHPDHMLAAALLVLAIARTDSDAELISYRGYNIGGEPENKIPPMFHAGRAVLARYEACATGCAPCGEECTDIDPSHETWLARRYAVGFRRQARGVLQNGDHCVRAEARGGVSLGDCAAAPLWTLDRGHLAIAGACLEAEVNGELAVNPCAERSSQRWFADDEGHLWSGVPPSPHADMYFDHLQCLSPSDSGVGAALCGKSNAPTWRFVPPLVYTPRSTLGLVATGRQVRLGDIDGDHRADLCAVIADELYCGSGTGNGDFGAAHRIATHGMPFSVEPSSLALGDVDGDNRGDACGRDATGVVCALSSLGLEVVRWSSSFGDSDARPGTNASLAVVDATADGRGEVCGVNAAGVTCAQSAPSAEVVNLSPWPDRSAIVLPADLDGDHRADWCAITPTGPACGVSAEGALSRDGVPWAFAVGGSAEDVPADSARSGAADIDGDGMSDLCMIGPWQSPTADGAERIACMRSQGRGFGPRTTVAAIPPGATALWLGDLNGDGRADACVDLGATIACAVIW